MTHTKYSIRGTHIFVVFVCAWIMDHISNSLPLGILIYEKTNNIKRNKIEVKNIIDSNHNHGT